MTPIRSFGLVMLVLGAILLWFMTTGGLATAPLLLIFGTLGGLGSVALGAWAVIGKF